MKAEISSFIPHPSSLRFQRWLDWLYPPRCRFCRESIFGADDCFCRRCRERIRFITHPLCGVCGRPFLDTDRPDPGLLGAWFALSSAKQTRAIRSLQDIPILRIAASLYLLFALVVTVAGNLPQLAGLVPDPVLSFFLPIEKENLAPYRVLHFLALAFLFSFVVPRDWRGFQWQALQPVIKCGEEWLAVFCAGVFLSFAGHFVLITGPNLLAMHFLVSIAGISAMAAVAYYVSWSRRQDYKPALSTR